jgi:hypothetical protein
MPISRWPLGATRTANHGAQIGTNLAGTKVPRAGSRPSRAASVRARSSFDSERACFRIQITLSDFASEGEQGRPAGALGSWPAPTEFIARRPRRTSRGRARLAAALPPEVVVRGRAAPTVRTGVWLSQCELSDELSEAAGELYDDDAARTCIRSGEWRCDQWTVDASKHLVTHL